MLRDENSDFLDYYIEMMEMNEDDVIQLLESKSPPKCMDGIDFGFYAWSEKIENVYRFARQRTKGWFQIQKIDYSDYYNFKESCDYLRSNGFSNHELKIFDLTGQLYSRTSGTTPSLTTRVALTDEENVGALSSYDYVDNMIYDEVEDIESTMKGFECIAESYFKAMATCGIIDVAQSIYFEKHDEISGGMFAGVATSITPINEIKILDHAFPGMYDLDELKKG